MGCNKIKIHGKKNGKLFLHRFNLTLVLHDIVTGYTTQLVRIKSASRQRGVAFCVALSPYYQRDKTNFKLDHTMDTVAALNLKITTRSLERL